MPGSPSSWIPMACCLSWHEMIVLKKSINSHHLKSLLTLSLEETDGIKQVPTGGG